MLQGRSIIHLDLDAFYASVEILDDPSLVGKPVVVGGTSGRGVVSAASYEARKYGVRSAMPMATARRVCPNGVFLQVRMERYQAVSRKVFDLFRRFTPLVEPLSVDEAFLDVTGCERLHGTAEEIAKKIKRAVRDEVGLVVSAGVASVKFVAKIASDLKKPDGLVVVPPGTEEAFLAPLPVERLWGVGEVTAELLRAMGVRTIGDLGRILPEELVLRFGERGRHLAELARGVDDRQVETGREAKSVGHEDTFEVDVRGGEAVRVRLLDLSERVAARMRKEKVAGQTVTLKVRYADFSTVTRAETIDRPTADGGTIYRAVLGLLAKTEAGARPVRLLGVSVSKLGEEGGAGVSAAQMPLFSSSPPVQLSLFASPPPPAPSVPASPDPAKAEALNRAVDALRGKFGADAVRPGSLLEK